VITAIGILNVAAHRAASFVSSYRKFRAIHLIFLTQTCDRLETWVERS